MALEDSNWPLPSQSRRVRQLLYLAEGIMLGFVIAKFSLVLFDLVLQNRDIDSAVFGLEAWEIGLFAVFLVLMIRAVVFVKVGLADDRDQPPQFRDWNQTRQWKWVGVAGLLSAGVLLGVSAWVWGWEDVVFWHGSYLVTGSVGVALIFYGYVFHKLGVEIF